MSPPPIDLSDDVRTLQLANRPTLAASLEFMANDIAPLLFGRQTGVFAVVEDAEGRRRTLVTLISGFRAESDLHIARNVVQQGPFEAIRNGERVTYVRVGKEGEPGPGVRIEYDRAGAISRIEAAGGVELPIPAVAPNEFGEVTLPATPHYDAITIGPNQHHAEMRLYDWATRNKLKIISMTPTRGCCVHCQRRLMAALKHEFHDLIPLHRQSKRAYIQYRRWLKRIGLAQRPNDLPVRLPPSELKLLSDSQSSALRNAARRDLATLSQIDPRLMRISRYLRVVGPAMLAFDVATSAAKAADQWRQGAGQEATTTLAALGGRLAGAYVGAEAFGAIGGGLGSVVPGLGTTIGALAGATIGGALGATVGEEQVKQLCHQILEWGKTPGRSGGAAPPPLPTPPPEQYQQPGVDALRREMAAAGYDPSQTALVCGGVEARLRHVQAGAPKDPQAALAQMGSHLPAFGPRGDPTGPVRDYPWASLDLYGHVLPKAETSVSQTSAVASDPIAAQLTPPPDPLPGLARAAGNEASADRDATPPPEPAPAPATQSFASPPRLPPGSSASTRGGAAAAAPSFYLGGGDGAEAVQARLREYDALLDGRPDPTLASALEADLATVRQLHTRAMLGSASTDLLELQRLAGLQSRLVQISDTVRHEDGERAASARRLVDEQRLRSEEDERRADRRGEDPPSRPADRAVREDEDRHTIEARRRDEEERVLAATLRLARKDREREAEADRLRRDGDDAREDRRRETQDQDRQRRDAEDAERRRRDEQAIREREADRLRREETERLEIERRAREEELYLRRQRSQARDDQAREADRIRQDEARAREAAQEQARRRLDAEDAERRRRDEQAMRDRDAERRLRETAERLEQEQGARRWRDGENEPTARRRDDDRHVSGQDPRRTPDAAPPPRTDAPHAYPAPDRGVETSDHGDADRRRQWQAEDDRRQAEEAEKRRQEDDVRRLDVEARRRRQDEEGRDEERRRREQDHQPRPPEENRRGDSEGRRAHETEPPRHPPGAPEPHVDPYARPNRAPPDDPRHADPHRFAAPQRQSQPQPDLDRRDHAEEQSRRERDRIAQVQHVDRQTREDERREQDEARRADERRREEDARNQREERRRQEEARHAEARRQVEEEKIRRDWLRREEAARRDDERRRADDERNHRDGLRRQEEARRAEARRQVEEEKVRRDWLRREEAARRTEELRRIEDERRERSWRRQQQEAHRADKQLRLDRERQAEQDRREREREDRRREVEDARQRHEQDRRQREIERENQRREREARQQAKQMRHNRSHISTTVRGSIIRRRP